EVVAIEMITIIQAIEYLQFQNKVSSSTKKMFDAIRNLVPAFKEDVVMYPYVGAVKKYLMETNN
ncbi:MAG TPA: histidine ammonia-lyase, partial [Flavobacteriaceae bacterium]|nr:histidine ammonia-lyase [Flavobacteriaceae bacterium]